MIFIRQFLLIYIFQIWYLCLVIEVAWLCIGVSSQLPRDSRDGLCMGVSSQLSRDSRAGFCVRVSNQLRRDSRAGLCMGVSSQLSKDFGARLCMGVSSQLPRDSRDWHSPTLWETTFASSSSESRHCPDCTSLRRYMATSLLLLKCVDVEHNRCRSTSQRCH